MPEFGAEVLNFFRLINKRFSLKPPSFQSLESEVQLSEVLPNSREDFSEHSTPVIFETERHRTTDGLPKN